MLQVNVINPKPLDGCNLRTLGILIDSDNKLANFPSSETRASWEDEVIHGSMIDGNGRPSRRESDGGVEIF